MAYSRGIQIKDKTAKSILRTAVIIAQREGLEQLSVKRILSEMKISNRVFYNRFRNIDDVIEVMYCEFVGFLREKISLEYFSDTEHYYDTMLDLATDVVKKMYGNDIHFRLRLLSYETSKENNRAWWLNQIQEILRDGIKRGLLKPMDEYAVSCGIWCFCLGFHKEALGSQISEEQAISAFRQSFSCLIDGIKASPNTGNNRE